MPFKIYRSSAGSGKTFTLVKEYLRLALSSSKPDSYRSILAITFTNKAAEEMKSRVLEVLSALSIPAAKEHDMAGHLKSEIGISTEELSKRAGGVLKHMLHHYSDISISTIDHFTHGLIRSFAQDLELSANFEVELDADRISTEIVDTVLTNVGEDKVLTKALLNVVVQQLDDERSWSIRQTLQKFSKGLFSEESRFHLDALKNIDLHEFNEIQENVRSQVVELEIKMVNTAISALKELENAGITAEMTYYGNSGGPFSYLEKIKHKNFELPKKRVLTSLNEDKWTSSKATKENMIGIESIKPKLVKALEYIFDLVPPWQYLKIISDNLYGVALLDEMLRIQHQFQQENDILHIGQFNHLVSDVVMKETAPFIYERIGNRYRHFLVDEFQDTSVLQWFNLLPLVDESLAQGNLCLVVGDAKQSIYRWRGGDVNQFIKLPNIYRSDYLNEKLRSEPEVDRLMVQRERAMNNQRLEDHLGSNYRSAFNVVSFNNKLFAGLRAGMNSNLQMIYDKSEQKIEKKEVGMVNIKFFEKTVADNVTCPEYGPKTLGLIRTWVDECLEDGFCAGDIAIILRSNKDAITVARYLVDAKYQVVSNESLLINSSPTVRTAINLATWLTYPTDKVNLVELIQNVGLVRDETDKTPSRLIRLNSKSDKLGLQLLTELFPTIDWTDLKRAGLFTLFEKLLHAIGSNHQDVYTNFFLDEVLGYSQKQANGLVGFLGHWEEKKSKLSIALSENKDAIRIMTIHKSKGLEFPVVIHPFADYPTKNYGNDVWAYLKDDELSPLDRIRVKTGEKLNDTPFAEHQALEQELKQMDMFNELYVAFTRPRFRLYASGWLSQKRTAKTAIQHVYQQLNAEHPSVEQELQYSLGLREKCNLAEKTENHRIELQAVGNPNWLSRIKISRPSKDKWKTANENDARNLGILIHEAMAHITTKADVNSAVSILVQDGRISDRESAQLKSRIEALFELKELNPLYNTRNNIRNEAAIQLETGKWLRPDRVAFNDDSAWVLDYKTGQQDSKHVKQIEAYKDALLQLGFKHVEGVLVYVNDGTVVPV